MLLMFAVTWDVFEAAEKTNTTGPWRYQGLRSHDQAWDGLGGMVIDPDTKHSDRNGMDDHKLHIIL